MVAANPNYRFPSARPQAVPPVHQLAERVRDYFDRHPEVSREEFLLAAVRREMQIREPRAARPRYSARPRLTAEDVRVHTWLIDRLAAVHYERHGLWPRLRRFLFGNRPVGGRG